MRMDKSYISLWLLLAAAFALFAVTSAFRIPEIGGYAPKSSGIYDALFAGRGDARTMRESDGDRPETPADTAVLPVRAQFPVACDTAAQTILLAGDSMLEGLGPRLAAYAEENGHTLYTVIWYSSTTETWGKSVRLRQYIERLKPSYIILSLGSNELNVRDIVEKREKYVRNILADIDTLPYLWIGPPNWKADTGINDLIGANTPQGAFFRSEGMSFERSGDGAHPTRSSAAAWADSIVRWMPQHSLHPIRMELPQKTSGKAARIFIHAPDDTGDAAAPMP